MFSYVKMYFFKTGCVYHGIGNTSILQTAVKIARIILTLASSFEILFGGTLAVLLDEMLVAKGLLRTLKTAWS